MLKRRLKQLFNLVPPKQAKVVWLERGQEYKPEPEDRLREVIIVRWLAPGEAVEEQPVL